MASHRQNFSAPIHEMMARLGIGAEDGVSPQMCMWFETALARCKACQAMKACRDWLNCAPLNVSVAPWFCRNGDILFDLQYDQPGPRRIERVEPGAGALPAARGPAQRGWRSVTTKSAHIIDTAPVINTVHKAGQATGLELASIADLERLEDDIEEAIIDLIGKLHDDEMIADLKRRKMHLEAEIAWLRHHASAGARGEPH